MRKNNVRQLFDQAYGNTVELKRECSEFTGLNLRTIQMLYANPNKGVSSSTAVKLAEYFSFKFGKDVLIDEIYVKRNPVIQEIANGILEKI